MPRIMENYLPKFMEKYLPVTPRRTLNFNTPFKVAELLLGSTFLQKLGFYELNPDDVVLKPALLNVRLR